MKFSTVFAAVAVAVVCAFSPVAAESEASIHLRVHSEAAGAICYAACPSGQYCSRGTTNCRGPKTAKECFNPATSLWLAKGCDPGFKCSNGKCVYA
jgi:hypothetical protein